MAWVAKVHRLSTKLRGPQSWLVASAFFGASLAIRLLLSPWLDSLKFLTFYPAIAGATLLCGWTRGVAVLFVSAATAWYLFYPPEYSFEIKDATTVAALVGFLMVGGFLVVLVAGMTDLINRLEFANLAQEGLFQELQHRVANNLQIVVAMLQQVRGELSDGSTIEAIAHAQDRIAAMSNLHRRLHDRKAYESGLAPLVTDLLHEVFRDLPVRVEVDIAPHVDLSLDQMTAISLLVNEAAVNAAKHVFRKGAGTTFKVALLKQKDSLRLLIQDDGPGIPQQSVSERQSLGMSIMQTFARQLGGSLRINGPTGTTLKVEIPFRSNH